MNSENVNSMNKGDSKDMPSQSQSQSQSQSSKDADRKQTDYKADASQKYSGATQPQTDRKSQSDDRSKKDIDAERHPEEQVTDPKEFTKKETRNTNEKSDRV